LKIICHLGPLTLPSPPEAGEERDMRRKSPFYGAIHTFMKVLLS
jgi:hypothetical protein